MAQFLLSTCSLSRRIKNFLLFPKMVVIKCHISRGVDILVRMTGIVFIILKDSAVMSDFIYLLYIYCCFQMSIHFKYLLKFSLKDK